jgi:dipeptidyl aminopeptidase/acylaminoacyl peptidase
MRTLRLVILCVSVARTLAGEPLEKHEVNLPKYEDIPKIERYASREEYELARRDRGFELTRVSYQSDGLTVFAYLYMPTAPQGLLPVVVFNRGSYTWDQFAGEYLTTFHRFAQAGFIVLAPMYRGSGGASGRDELGGADLLDLLNTVSLLPQIPHADSTSVFMYGESRGGMMTYQAIRENYPMRAAAVYGAFTNLAELAAPGGKFDNAALMIWPDYADRKKEISGRRSALEWPDRFSTPVLIMHGGADGDVPPAQAIALAMKLQEFGKSYELIIRSGSNHTLSNWRIQRDAQAIEWFNRHKRNS